MKLFPIFLYRTPTFHAGNHWAAGAGFFWFPFVILAELFTWCTGFLNSPGIEPGGFSPIHMTAINAASFIYAILGLALIPGILRRLGLQAKPLLYPALFLGTPLLFYSVRAGSMSHAVSFFANTLFLRMWFQYRDKPDAYSAWLSGLTAGLLILVRPQECFMLLFPVIYLFNLVVRRESFPGLHLLSFIPGIFIGLAPHFLINRVLMGSFTGNMQIAEMAWSNPAISGVLVASFHGLFTWSPVLIPGVIGLLGLSRKQPLFAGIALFIFAVQTYLNAAFPAWWGSGSFGGRRFLGTLILLAPGIAWLLAHKHRGIRRGMVIFTILATLWSTLLFITHSTVEQLISFESFGELIQGTLLLRGADIFVQSMVGPPGGGAFFLVKLGYLLICCAGVILTGWCFRQRKYEWSRRILFFAPLLIALILLFLTVNATVNSLQTDREQIPDRAMSAPDIEKGRRLMRLPVLKGLADMATYQSDTPRAEKLLLEILDEMPENFSVSMELLSMYIDSGKDREALDLYNDLADPSRNLPMGQRMALAQSFGKIQSMTP